MLHIFGSGVHATGLGEGSAIEPWPELASCFLDNVFNNPEVFKPEYNRGSQANALFLAPPLRRLGDRFLQQTAHRLDEIAKDHPEGFLPVHPAVAPPVEMAHAHNLLGRHKSALIQRKRKDRMVLQHLNQKRNHP